jgi:hypothetical protein
VPTIIIPFQLLLSPNVAAVKESISGIQADHIADLRNSENGEGFQFWTFKIIKLKEENLPSSTKTKLSVDNIDM